MKRSVMPGQAMASGLLAAGIATGCMSLVMLVSRGLDLQGEPPPKKITRKMVQAAVGEPPPRSALLLLTAAAHLAYGVGAGTAFAVLRRKFGSKRRPMLEGTLFGLGIWLLSYKGWLPAVGLMPPPERDQPGRTVTTAAAHLVYGAVLGAGTRRMETFSDEHAD
jgi:hypothetical protein